MTIYTFAKGSDIKIKLDDKALTAVLSLNIKETTNSYEVYEVLQGECLTTLPLQEEFNITVKKIKDENFMPANPNCFNICISSKNTNTFYEQCFIEQICESVGGSKYIEQTISIKAKTKNIERRQS